MRTLQSFEKYLVLVLLFLFPTQLTYHFWPSWAFVFGIRSDLLSPAIYLTDILIFILLLFKAFKDRDFFKPLKKYKALLVLGFIFALVNSTFSASLPVTVYKWFKFVEFFLLAFYFAKQKVVSFSEVVMTLFYSSLFFSMIGIAQFIKEGTIGGILYYLGERSFNLGTPGVALVSLNGALHLRAYSTFAHPNSLAGFLGAVSLLILISGKLKKTPFNIFGVTTILTCFILSFSLSAYLGIFLVFAFYMFSKNKRLFKWAVPTFLFTSIIGSLFLPLLSSSLLQNLQGSSQSINQRLELANIAGRQIGQRFFIGQGLGTFIVNIPMFRDTFSYSWLLQPVHNIYLLVFAEVGIIGLLTFCYLIYQVLIKDLKEWRLYLLLPLVFVLFTGLFDHYSLTLQQNLLLGSLLIGLSLRDAD